MKDKKNTTPVPAQVSEETMKDPRELADEELKDVAGGLKPVVIRGLGDSGIEGSVPIIRPF